MMHGMAGGWGGGMGRGRWGRGDQEDERDGQLYDHKVVMRLTKYLRPYWKQVAATIVAMLAYTGTVVALPWLVKLIIDGDIGEKYLDGLNLVALIFVGVAALQYLTNYIHLRIMARVGQQVLLTMRVELFRHIQRLSMSFFDRNQTGQVMSRVQNDVQQLQEFLSIVVVTLADVLSIGGIVTAMVIMDLQLALITLSVVPLLFIMLAVWQQYARGSFMKVREAIATVNAGLQENISGVRVVQSLNREQANIQRFGRDNRENLGANLKASRYSAALMPSVEVLSALGLALVVFFGGSMVLDKTLEVGVLVAFALYIQRFFEPVRNLTMQYGSLQRAMASGARIFQLMDVKPEVVDAPEAAVLPTVRGDITYKGVGFHYEEDSPVLEGVDLDVTAGETVALVGPTGAGKTTLVSLLMRLYDVTEGRITLDGHDVRDVSLDSLARQISVVPQEPYLFSGTVAENIRYNRTEATDEQMLSAAKAVGAHEFIAKLENGYDTTLQERGGNLSIGQRQLISFARALVADPRVLILDEATANIDTYTEMLIQRALAELLKDRTALVIAHRLSTVRGADSIVVVDEGRVVERGTHAQLMALDGVYARLSSYTTNGEGAPTPEKKTPKVAVSGTWNLTVDSPRGSRNGTLELAANGATLKGMWSGERGDREISGGTVEGSAVSWKVVISGPMGEMTMAFTGKLDGDTMSGEVVFGSFGSGIFEATRVSA